MKKREGMPKQDFSQIIQKSTALAVSQEWCEEQSDETLRSMIRFYKQKSEEIKGKSEAENRYMGFAFTLAQGNAVIVLAQREIRRRGLG